MGNSMKYRELGKTGLKVSEIGFGAWALGSNWGEQKKEDSIEALHTAIDQGVNIIDTAAGYGNGKSEQIICEVLKTRSENVYVATKTPPKPGPWPPSPYCRMEDRYPEEYLIKNVDERINMLGTKQLDILLLHTWTRAWNGNPRPLMSLKKLKDQGKIKYIGISTPEHDQNAAVDLIREGFVDVIEVVFNIFEQEPAAQLLPSAKDNGIGIISRVAFDEGSLTGKFDENTKFPEGDFRQDYFSGDRLSRTLLRVEKVREDLKNEKLNMAECALKFVLDREEVSTVIPGMRNKRQAELNTQVSALPDLKEDVLNKLRTHNWQKGFWYLG